jgi:hypothetical protein
MPTCLSAFLCEFVRPEPAGAPVHALGLGIDTVMAPELPAHHGFGLVFQLSFEQNELDQNYELKVQVVDPTGTVIDEVEGAVGAQRRPGAFGPTLALIAFNRMFEVNRFGSHEIKIVIGGQELRSIGLQVLPAQQQPQQAQA